MDMVIQVLAKTVCISHSTNTLEEGMSPIILLKVIGKIVG